MLNSRKNKLALGITPKTYLFSLSILLLTLLIPVGLTWYFTAEQAGQRIDNTLNDALTNFQGDFKTETDDLQTLASWLVGQPAFVKMVRSHDKAGLNTYLQPWVQVGIADALTVWDRRGSVLVRVMAKDIQGKGDSVAKLPGVSEGLNGFTSSRVDIDNDQRLQADLSLPIRSSLQESPIGVLLLSLTFNGGSGHRRTSSGSTLIAIVDNGQIALARPGDQTRRPSTGVPAPAELVRAERAGLATNMLTLRIESETYLFRFVPLKFPTQGTVGMYGAGVPISALETQRNQLLNVFAPGLILVLAIVLVVSYLAARALTSPIRTLHLAVQQMAQGELSQPIVLPRKDELGDLGRRMDVMRLQLRQALQTSAIEKSRYEAVIRSMSIAAIVTDQDQRIVSLNPAAEVMLKACETDLIGCLWIEQFVPADDESSRALSIAPTASALGLQSGFISRGRYRPRAQMELALDIIASPVRLASEWVGSVLILQDNSSQERLLQAKDEFIANVAHELRSPIASLRAFTEILAEDYGNVGERDSKMLVESLVRATLRFQRLVENLIDVGSIQASRFRVRPVPTNLDGIIKEAVDHVSIALTASNQPLLLSPAEFPYVVLADPPRVVQVIVNLLSNASKYSPEGETISLAVRVEEERVRLEVMDCGTGIPPEDQAQIFRRFYRAKLAEEGGMGIGLGLALSKAIVEAHGGEIGLISQVGQGSTFWFTLPLVKTP